MGSKDLEALHSAVMAIEELMIRKKLVSLEELNEAIKKAECETREAMSRGKIPKKN